MHDNIKNSKNQTLPWETTVQTEFELKTPEQIVNHIIERFAKLGMQSYGEAVTMEQHCLQSATFAQQEGQPESMIVACLLHDYGHLVHDLGEDIADKGIDAHHEVLGAEELKKWFGDEVVEPGRLHVDAKRYLCAVDKEYFDNISDASRLSLELQGGPMGAEEVTAFRENPYFEDAVTLRRYDDLGKQVDMQTPDLEAFREMLISHVRLAK